jgi:hypothetical protein
VRAITILLASVLLFGYASAVRAQDEAAEKSDEPAAEAPSDEAAGEEAAAEEGEAGFLSRYGNDVKNTFLGGLNGLITWPADPVMLAVKPTDEMRGLPGGVVTGPLTGFFAGTLQGVYRLAGGALDVLLAPLSFFPQFSPEPRYKVIPGWEHGSS